jgi:hypothetical protein
MVVTGDGAHPRIVVERGDIRETVGDVLVLKYAQQFYGADAVIAELLPRAELTALPPPGLFRLIGAPSGLGVRQILWVGTQELHRLDYVGLEDLGRRAIAALGPVAPETRRIVMTTHGAGYGLDERSAFEAVLAGVVSAIHSDLQPGALDEVVFVERSESRARRLDESLSRWLPRHYRWADGAQDAPNLPTDPPLASRRSAFIAMPFDPELDDLYELGIQEAVHGVELDCVRNDHEFFDGPVIDRIRSQIEAASVVIAEVTAPNPNVFLEVGYAWGRSVPTLFITKGEPEGVPFDVRAHQLFTYSSISDLKRRLGAAITARLD